MPPIDYALEYKNARLAIVRDALDGGSLEILSNEGARLASIAFDKPSGDVLVATLVFIGFPKHVMSEAEGKAAVGRLKDKAGATVAHGLTVGTKDAKVVPDIVLGHLDVKSVDVIRIDRAEIRHG